MQQTMPHRAFREVVVLRELEGLSYKEIAAVIGTPIKTVMSRLLNDTELDQFIHYLEMR